MTEPHHPTRTEQAEITAKTCRTERTRRARLLRELRRIIQAYPTDSAAREYLQERRAEFASDSRPNPDRARECRRESFQAIERYNTLMADYDGSFITDILLGFAAEDADVWGILSIKARY